MSGARHRPGGLQSLRRRLAWGAGRRHQRGEYHRTANCPGAFATAEQRVDWLFPYQEPVKLTDYVEALRELGCGALLGADSCAVAPTAGGRVPSRNVNCTAARRRYRRPYERLAPREPEGQFAS